MSFRATRSATEVDVYGYWEVGALLDGLARCERPAVSGLDEGPFSLEMHDDLSQFDRYKRSQLTLTEFGKGVLVPGDQHLLVQPD